MWLNFSTKINKHTRNQKCSLSWVSMSGVHVHAEHLLWFVQIWNLKIDHEQNFIRLDGLNWNYSPLNQKPTLNTLDALAPRNIFGVCRFHRHSWGREKCVCLKSFSSNASLLILDCARMRIEFHNKVTKNLGHANIDLIYVNLFNYFMKHICTNTAISWSYNDSVCFVSKVSVYHTCGGFSMFRKTWNAVITRRALTQHTHSHTHTFNIHSLPLSQLRSSYSHKTHCNFANESNNNKQFEVEWIFTQMLEN